MKVDVHNTAGEKVDSVELPSDIFEVPINVGLMHQAFLRQRANARQVGRKSKTRSDKRGGGAKPWRQKGTGRARHSSRRSPVWVGGGKAHGPAIRNYTKRMPRQMRRAALRCALSEKLIEKGIVVVDKLTVSEAKTKLVNDVLNNLAPEASKYLVLMAHRDDLLVKSVRNLRNASTLHAGYLNVKDLAINDIVIMPLDSLEVIKSYLGSEV
ncbi:MAG TPA: 50S ribosomal protein L4 [Chloroflexi bacterium]|nr:50S ribosomal protein L4 [Chloroflexota bacterium]